MSSLTPKWGPEPESIDPTEMGSLHQAWGAPSIARAALSSQGYRNSALLKGLQAS